MKARTILAALALSIPAVGFAAAPAVSPAQFQTAIEAAKSRGFEGVIAVSDTTRDLYSAAIGRADRERGIAHRIDERWLWASVTKQVTAVLVMREVQRGRISLDQSLSNVLPMFGGTSRDAITVRQLLQHTSGLPNPDDTPATADGVPAFYTATGPAIPDSARAIGFCAGTPKAAPGSAFEYNNCDYLVLGAILENVTGQRYADLIAGQLATPLGLRTVRLAPDRPNPFETKVVGYDAKGRFGDVNVATFGAAGALTGTASDLLAFDRALLGNRLLDQAATATLWQGDAKLGYEALGAWSFPAKLKDCARPIQLIERRGDVAGIQVRNVIAPEAGLAMVVFTNRDDLDFGEVWQGRGLSFDLLGAILCPPGGGL